MSEINSENQNENDFTGESSVDFEGLRDTPPSSLNGFDKAPPNMENGTADKRPPNMEIPKATLKEIEMTDYIQESLDKVAHAEGFRNYDIKIDHGSSVGDGFVGLMLKVIIQEKDQQKSLVVLAKIPPQNKIRRQAMNSMILFEREVYMYNVLLPEFVKFQEENRISKAIGFYNFPKVYYAEYSEEKDDAIIIMEDLREKGCRMWDKYKTIDFEHAKLLISSLARLHGVSLVMKVKKPEQFEKFKQLNDLFFEINKDNKEFIQFMESSVLKGIDSLDPNDVNKKQKATKLMNNFREQLDQCLDPKLAEPFAVVNHGDCWTNNYLYHYNQRGVPEDIVLIDWQISRYCSPIIDLVYFLFICTDHGFRVKHWDELINIYHRTIRDLISRAGSNVMTQLPTTALLRQLKKFGKFGVVMAAFIVPFLQTKKEDLLDMDVMAEQIKDQQMGDMMEYFNTQMASVTTRIRDIFEDAIKYGYL